MNEEQYVTADPEAVPVHQGPSGSAGAALREAREAAGLHISALAVSLKVPVKKLEALEADDLEQLPDAVFARALAATVCRTLKIDPEPILRLLPQLETPPLQVGSQAGSPRIDAHAGMSAGLARLPRPVLYITAALLVAAVLVWLVPTLTLPGSQRVSGTDGVAVRIVPNQVNRVETPVAIVVPPAPATAASESVAAVAPSPAAESVEPAPAAPEKATDVGAVAVFTTRSSSWIQVTGADGVVHLRKTMEEGETARINGAFPLSVVIGRANAVDVQVRGKPFDLSAVAKDNVARFQIK